MHLKAVISHTLEELEEKQALQPIEGLKNNLSQQPKIKSSFISSLRNGYTERGIGVITEIKRASPSAGSFQDKLSIQERSNSYQQAGANAISIVTEKQFFKGTLDMISSAKTITNLPILQKDFIIHDYQIHESATLRVDALLLIVRILTGEKINHFVELCTSFGIEPVVEVYSQEELDIALQTKAQCIAVNARDLETLEISVDKACLIAEKIPKDRISLGFSGIETAEDVNKYKSAGCKGVLIGSTLMRSGNVASTISELLGR